MAAERDNGKSPDDPRVAAAQYRIDRITADIEAEHPDPGGRSLSEDAEPRGNAGSLTAADRTAYVEQVIRQAIREGAFDGLPGEGKPLPDLGTTHDPNWWIRRKIEREGLTGLGPPALQLRVEDAALDELLDGMSRESEVRDHLLDFNERVRTARMQLLGGPPVITPMRDVEHEVAAWRERRAARAAAETAEAERGDEGHDGRRRGRWRARRRTGKA